MSYLDNLSDRDLTKSMLASLRRNENKKAAVSFQLEADDVLTDQLMAILAAIEALREAVMAMPPPVVNLPAPAEIPAPVIHVDPPDLADVVNAVVGIQPGATAAEIAAALADVVAPVQTSEDTAAPLRQVAEALEKLDFRLKGMGTQAYGGGSVNFSPAGMTQLTEALAVSPKEATLTPTGYQQLTSLASATALTVPVGSTYAMLQAETQAVRMRDDGVNPTTATGMRLMADTVHWYTGSLSAVRLIEETASAKVNVSYYA